MKIEGVIECLKGYLGLIKSDPNTKQSDIYFYELLIYYYESFLKAKEEGKYTTAHGIFAPVEIFHAMDIVPFNLENYAVFAGSYFGDGAEYLSLAASYGMPVETCSCHRLLHGLAIKDMLPRPDFLIWPSSVCDAIIKGLRGLDDFFKTFTFYLDLPYRYTDRTVAYYAKDLEKLIEFLEERTGRKLDMEELKRRVDLALQATKLWGEIYELRKAVPAPMGSKESFGGYLISVFLAGTQEAVTYFEMVRDECKKVVEERRGALSEERHRIYFPWCPPMFDMSILDWMEKEFGAVLVMDPFCSRWTGREEVDPSRPFEAIAKRTFSHPLVLQFNGPMDNLLDDLLTGVRDFRADGAIFFALPGCKQSSGTIRAVKDALRNDLGIPTLVVDCDLFDKSYNSVDEVKGKMEGFFEILGE